MLQSGFSGPRPVRSDDFAVKTWQNGLIVKERIDFPKRSPLSFRLQWPSIVGFWPHDG
jgi:hypothetical protein